VRFSVRSLTSSPSFLWRISPEIWMSGVRGRLGTLHTAVLSRRLPDVPRIDAGWGVLVDSNPNKVPHAERVFGRPMVIVDPVTIRHTMRWRVALLLTCMLPTRSRAVVVAIVHAHNLSGRLTPEQRVYLWNPYTLMQFAVSEVLAVEATYHLNAGYPRLRAVGRAHGCQVALDLLGYAADERVNTLQPWSLTRDEPVLVVYLSKLDEMQRHRSELRLLDAVRAWRDMTAVPIEIYIHYTDRQTARQEPRHAKFFDEFGDLVRDENSLDRLSSSQISISALSTIGLDLLSMDIAHFVMTPNDSSSEAVGVWQSRLDASRHDVLSADDSPESWLATIDHKYPARSRAVFLGAD